MLDPKVTADNHPAMRSTGLNIHAVVLALNEESFITSLLGTLYPFCSGISVLTQYDRDWYGKPVIPDRTVEKVLGHPDPAGRINLVVRRFPDEAAARNSEMLAVAARADRGIMSHGSPMEQIRRFHAVPDYFWIVDADEFYDVATIPAILGHLAARRPRGMRVHGYNYVRSWNQRVPAEAVRFCHFGFLRPGVLFESQRTVTWNESRLAKLLRILRLPDFSARLFGFIECPMEVGVFHHGCWLGSRERLAAKAARSSHQWMNHSGYAESVSAIPHVRIPTPDLPGNIRGADWPAGMIER